MESRVDYGKSTDSWYVSLDDEINPIALSLRKLIHRTVPDVVEQIKQGTPVFDKNGIICALRSGKDFIALQFYEIGTNLDDPQGILEGSGKKMRHVKVHSLKEVRTNLFTAWIRYAADNNIKQRKQL